MKSIKVLTISQLAQRVDELQELEDTLDQSPEWLKTRLAQLKGELNFRLKSDTFNKGVITPLPPDHVDITNDFVVTPKAPSQVDREYESWMTSLDS